MKNCTKTFALLLIMLLSWNITFAAGLLLPCQGNLTDTKTNNTCDQIPKSEGCTNYYTLTGNSNEPAKYCQDPSSGSLCTASNNICQPPTDCTGSETDNGSVNTCYKIPTTKDCGAYYTLTGNSGDPAKYCVNPENGSTSCAAGKTSCLPT